MSLTARQVSDQDFKMAGGGEGLSGCDFGVPLEKGLTNDQPLFVLKLANKILEIMSL